MSADKRKDSCGAGTPCRAQLCRQVYLPFCSTSGAVGENVMDGWLFMATEGAAIVFSFSLRIVSDLGE